MAATTSSATNKAVTPLGELYPKDDYLTVETPLINLAVRFSARLASAVKDAPPGTLPDVILFEVTMHQWHLVTYKNERCVDDRTVLTKTVNSFANNLEADQFRSTKEVPNSVFERIFGIFQTNVQKASQSVPAATAKK